MKLFKKRIVILGWVLMTLIVAGISIAKAALPFTSISLWTSDLWNVLVTDAEKDTGLWSDIKESLSGDVSTWSYSIIDDSPRFFIWWTNIDEWKYILTMEYEDQKISNLICSGMLYWYYYNPEFLENKLLPLNVETMDKLNHLNLNKEEYLLSNLDITWWFYTDCRYDWQDLDNWAVFWIIKYSFNDNGKDRVLYLLGWVDINDMGLKLVNELFLNKELKKESWERIDPDLWTVVPDVDPGMVIVGDFSWEGQLTNQDFDIYAYGKFFDSVSDKYINYRSSVMLVRFEESVPEDWIITWDVKIQWLNGAIWWWWLSESNDVLVAPEEEYTMVTDWYATIELETWMEGKYICAFWEIGDGNKDIICSEHEVKFGSVRFERDVPEDWIVTWDVKIKWECGNVTKWWFMSEDDNVSVVPEWYTSVNNLDITLELEAWMNEKYICAFWQWTWQNPQIRCSENKVKLDNIDPRVELLAPTSSDILNLWDYYNFEWSGLDDESGILWYLVTINGVRISENPIHSTSIYHHLGDDSGTWIWEWSVEAIDEVGNSAVAIWRFGVSSSDTWHGSPSFYVQFVRPVPSMWSRSWRVDIEWASWVIWWWWLSDNYNISIVPNEYNSITTWLISIELTSWMNGKYICAFGSYWEYQEMICSAYKVKIDNTDPEIQLLSPTNWTEFYLGDGIGLKWSGSDISWISGYMLNLNNRSWSTTLTQSLNNTTTLYNYTANEVWNWEWRVNACDYVWLCVERSGNFIVLETWNVNYTWWFYLVRPLLWSRFNLWDSVTFAWNSVSQNSWYIWEVSKIWWSLTTWFTNSSSMLLSGWYFTTWTYSWSVYNVASEDIKSVSAFYVVENGDEPDLKVNDFEFEEEEYAWLDEYYTSNRIRISWMTDDWYTLASLNRWSLYINGDFVWSQWYVTNGDKVYIEMKASGRRGETVTAILTIWVWSDAVSWSYKVTTDDDLGGWNNANLSPLQKLWASVFVDNLVEMYQYDEWKLATFLSTFMQVLKDKIYEYNTLADEAEHDWDDDLANEYKLYKNALVFLYSLVEYRYDNIEVEERTVYVAPNGRQYEVEYDEDRMAYTSPDFAIRKYFPTWEAFTAHIDKNNAVSWNWGMVWNIITTHNWKVYMIYEKNWRWTSSDFKTPKYFDTKEDIVNHILANNPASSWNHKLDTDFIQVNYTAPNWKTYRIFKTSSEWNNPDMYSSYDFVDAKYFTSLDAAKKFINQSNPKK